MKLSNMIAVACITSILPNFALADFTEQAPSYVDLLPIADLVDATVGQCGAQDVMQLPMIEWSGDFPTVYGNGGVTTDPDSLFALFDLEANLYIENDLVRQLDAYLNCDSPFMRLTQGQAMTVASITQTNPETEMVAFYKHSFSQGDHLVTTGINEIGQLCDANIAIMRYGPHVDFMGRILSDAGCDIGAMQDSGQILWTENLTGVNSPYHALVSDADVNAAFTITPDMLALTSGDAPGSQVTASTQQLSRAISDVYVVRRDWFLANQERVKNLTHALFLAGEEFQGIMGGLNQSLSGDAPTLTADQQVVLDQMVNVFESAPDAIEAGFFWLDADYSGYPGNVRWAIETNPRGWLGLNNEVQSSLAALGLSDRAFTLAHAGWNYEELTEGLSNTNVAEQPTFDVSAVAVSNVTDVTNDMLMRGADAFQKATIDARHAVEKSAVGIEAVEYQNQRIIETLEEAINITQEGKRAREEADRILNETETALKDQLKKVS